MYFTYAKHSLASSTQALVRFQGPVMQMEIGYSDTHPANTEFALYVRK